MLYLSTLRELHMSPTGVLSLSLIQEIVKIFWEDINKFIDFPVTNTTSNSRNFAASFLCSSGLPAGSKSG
jgi:hypothetical protein